MYTCVYIYIYINIYVHIYCLHANNLNLIAITRGSSDTHEEVFDGHQQPCHECKKTTIDNDNAYIYIYILLLSLSLSLYIYIERERDIYINIRMQIT